MGIYKRASGRYAVRIDLDPTSTGGRRRKSIGTYRTKKEAQAAERQAIEIRERGTDLSPQKMTVAELIERYLERCRTKGLATKSIERYGELARHVIPNIGSTTVARLTPAQVAFVYGEATYSGLSPKTVWHVHGFMHAVLRWAVEQNLCVRNVADVAKRDLPKKQQSPAHAITEHEARALLKTAEGSEWQPFFVLALCTGARRAEIAALTWGSIDFDLGVAKISRSLVKTRGGLEFKGTKTGQVRTVPLNRTAVAALRAHRAKQNADRLRAGDAYENSDLVFADSLGRPWNPGSASNAFTRLARQAGISTTRLHDLRHSTATWLLQAGVDVRTVAAVLGHTSATTTLTTYAHVLPGAEAQAVERIAERLGSA